MSDQGEVGNLLNIKQAAALLNVSEVSLRRWTNAGTLPCVRIGARRERRFRGSDLDAYLAARANRRAGQSVAPAAGVAANDAPAPQGAVAVDGMTLAAGSHLCLVYKADHGRLRVALPFLRDGLARGDACLVVARADVGDAIARALEASGADVKTAIRSGQLEVVAQQRASPIELCDTLELKFVARLAQGYKRIRLVGDMAWTVDAGLGEDELLAFERLYDHEVAPRYPVISLCLYDARLFSGLGVV